MSAPASERVWLPAGWEDEVIPSMLPSPDHFLEREGEAWFLRLPPEDPERDNEFYKTELVPGQVVEFRWSEHYGHRLLQVHADGSWSLDEPIPEKATQLFAISEGVIGLSPAELAAELEPGEHVISAYTWSETIPFRLEIDGEGPGRLVMCAGAN